MTTGSNFVVWPPSGGWLWRPLIGASLSQIVLGVMRPTVIYAGLELGADGFLIGVLAASFSVIPMLIALPIGRLSGSMRHIAVVPYASAILLLIACLFAASARSIEMLIVASILLGVANLGVLLGAQSWISRSAPSARYNDGFGWMTAGMAVGQAIGPLLAGVLVGPDAPTWSGIGRAFLAAAACALLLSAVFVSRATRKYGGNSPSAPLGVVSILITTGVARYIFVSAAVLTSVDILTAYLPVLGSASGISPVLIGAMLAVRGVTSAASRLLLGPLGRRFSQTSLLVASLCGTALCLVALAFFPVPWLLFVALGIGGFFLGLGQPLTMTAVALALPAYARSSGLALRLVGNRIAQTATPLVAGIVAGTFGVTSVFLVQVVGLASSAVWELSAARSAKKRSSEGDEGEMKP